jgi:hypothetical protein
VNAGGRLSAVIVAAFVGVGVASTTSVAPAPDLLAPMRLALGGDAAIDAVTKFAVAGSIVRRMGGFESTSGYEVFCELPDKFITTTTHTSDMGNLPRGVGMSSTTTVSTSGFNGGDPISRFSGDEFTATGMPTVIRRPESTDPAEVAAARRRRVSEAHREFLRFVLPRFGKSFPGADVKLEDAGTATVDGRAVYQVKVTDWGNRVHVLAIDAVTNLPVRMTWQDRPVVSRSLGTVTSTRVGQPAAPDLSKLPADPTAGMPDVEHVLTFKKFKLEKGLNWPREISKTVDGKPAENWNLGKVNLTPKFSAGTFKTSK